MVFKQQLQVTKFASRLGRSQVVNPVTTNRVVQLARSDRGHLIFKQVSTEQMKCEIVCDEGHAWLMTTHMS